METNTRDIIADLRVQEQRYRRIESTERRPYTWIILPGIALIILFLIPFLWGLYLTLTDYRLNDPTLAFNWGRNYWRVLTSDRFWRSTLLTFCYTSAAVSIEMVLGYCLAMLLDHETAVCRIMRRLIVVPFMVAPIIGTLLLKLMLNNRFGVVNFLLGFLGLGDFPWAASANTAMLTVVMVDVWIFTPFVVLILLAGKRGAPTDPLEAAAVDGARQRHITRRILIPIMMPTILIAFIFRIIDSIIVFDIVWGMTAGGPGDATLVYSATAYVRSFLSLDVSQGTAVLVLAYLIVVVISRQLVKQWNAARRRLS